MASDLGPIAPSEESSVAVAWRVLSSPRTLLGLTSVLAVVLALAAALPQRPTASELVRRLPFASAEAASDLGLTDVLVAWPTLLVLLLIALNVGGLVVARAIGARSPVGRQQRRGPFVAEASAVLPQALERVRARVPMALRIQGNMARGRKGFDREGAALAFIGLTGLLLGLAVARSSALDARIDIAPGTGMLSTATVRDGDVYIDRAQPFGLLCERPDPRDPSRAFGCRLMERSGDGGTIGGSELSLAPGYTTKVGERSFRPLWERLRGPTQEETFDLLLTRRSGGRDAVERLRLEPGKPVALRAGAGQPASGRPSVGETLTAFPGPDGPLLVVESEGRVTLLGPPDNATPEVAGALLSVEAHPPSALIVQASTAPEALLVLVGTLFFALGLALMGLVPHLEVELAPAGDGTAVTFWSSNRPGRPREALARLTSTEPPSSLRSRSPPPSPPWRRRGKGVRS